MKTSWPSKKRRKLTWTCLPFIRSGKNHLARYSERGKKTRPTEEEVGRQHQGMDRPGVCQFLGGSGGQRKMEKTACKVTCGARTTLAVKGWVRVWSWRDDFFMINHHSCIWFRSHGLLFLLTTLFTISYRNTSLMISHRTGLFMINDKASKLTIPKRTYNVLQWGILNVIQNQTKNNWRRVQV